MYFNELTEEVIHTLGYCKSGCNGDPHNFLLDTKTKRRFINVEKLLNRKLDIHALTALKYIYPILSRWQRSKKAYNENVAAGVKVIDQTLKAIEEGA